MHRLSAKRPPAAFKETAPTDRFQHKPKTGGRTGSEGGVLTRLAQRRPLTAFAAIGLATSYTLVSIWGLAYHGLVPGGGLAQTLGIKAEEVAAGILLLGLVPAALFVTWATSGRQGLRVLMNRVFTWRTSPGWWVVALLGLPVLTVGLALLLGDDLKDVELGTVLLAQMTYLIVNFAVINLWEETVWVGVVQTRLEERRSLFVASVITAIPFAAVHVPLEFFGDHLPTALDLLAAFAVYFVIGVIVRPMFAVLRRATQDSVFLVGLTHAAFNQTNTNDGLAANLVDGEMRGLTGLVACVVLGVALRILYRRRMTRPSFRPDPVGP